MKYIILLALLIPGIATAAFDTSLKYGSKGSSVVELQEFLIDQNCLKSEATGNFYSLTLRAVKCFQQAHALPVTGYFGPMSRAVANDMIAAETASSTMEEIAEVGTTTPVVASIAPVATTTTIIQYITYQMPPQVAEPVVAAVVAAPAPVVATPAPVIVNPRLHVGTNDAFHFTKNEEWTVAGVNYMFAGYDVQLISFGVYADEPDAKELVGEKFRNDNVFTFQSPTPLPAGKYVIKAIVHGNTRDDFGQKLQVWTTSLDVETLENK